MNKGKKYWPSYRKVLWLIGLYNIIFLLYKRSIGRKCQE